MNHLRLNTAESKPIAVTSIATFVRAPPVSSELESKSGEVPATECNRQATLYRSPSFQLQHFCRGPCISARLARLPSYNPPTIETQRPRPQPIETPHRRCQHHEKTHFHALRRRHMSSCFGSLALATPILNLQENLHIGTVTPFPSPRKEKRKTFNLPPSWPANGTVNGHRKEPMPVRAGDVDSWVATRPAPSLLEEYAWMGATFTDNGGHVPCTFLSSCRV